MLTELYRQPGSCTMPLARKSKAQRKLPWIGLERAKQMYLKTAEQCDAEEWTKEAAPCPVVPHKQKVTFSDNVTVIPTNRMPRRAAREVANLNPTTVVGNNGSPARNTRARFAVQV